MSKKISEIMTCNIVTLKTDNTIRDAAKLMLEEDIGFIPVSEDNSLVGVVTDRDLVIRGYALGKSDQTKLEEVMTDYCISVERDAYVDDVAEIMSEHKIRRVCVLDGDELVGICAIGDIALANGNKRDAGIALSHISIPANHGVFITNI